MKTLLLSLFSFFSIISYGQSYAKIKVVDSSNRTDEITIGNYGNIGIDTALGEVNLFNIPTDTLEIRTIQRPNMTCLFDYEQNIDLKIDHRPVCGTLIKYSNFIIDVFATDYPVYVIFAEEEEFECCVTEYYIVDTLDCGTRIECGYSPLPGDTLFVLDGVKPNRFVFYPEVCVSTDDLTENDLIIFPNPTNNKITIPLIDFESQIESILIFDLGGKLISDNSPPFRDPNFTFSFGEQGVYIVSIKTEKNVVSKKVIVQ